MPNDYFNFTTPLSRQTIARAEAINSLFRQFEDAVALLPPIDAILAGKVTFGADTGTANAYAIALARAPDDYEPGLFVTMLAGNTNTGGATLDVNGLGVKQILNFFGAPLAPGDIQAGATVPLVYDGTAFRFIASTPVPLTTEQIAAAIAAVGAAPVQSVAGRTGDVTLAVADVSGAVSTARTLTAGTGLAGGGDLAANRSFDLAGQALALHNLNTNGLIVRTGSATVTGRTITAGTGVSVSNGNGVSGDPTVAADVASDANLRAGEASKLADAAGLRTAAAPVALTDGANIAVDMNAGRVFTVTLGGNRTLDNATNQAAGQSGVIIVKQDGTGGRTLSYDTHYKFAGGVPTLSTAANAIDVIAYYVEASGTILCSFSEDFS